MAGINRLTYYFYSYKEKIDEEKIRFSTNFPFTVDQQLLINRPVENSDIVSEFGSFDANPTLDNISSRINVSNFGYYDDQNWFLGVSINRVVVYDGLFKIPDGINANFVNVNGFNQGVVEIDESVLGFKIGVLDSVEIVIISAQTWTPWLYYGYDYGEGLGQARAFLLKNIDNGSWRVPTNMGGIFSSLVPAQAIQMRHFTNINLSEITAPVIIPFPSAFLVGAPGGASSSSNNVFHTADVIDGNGELKIRSSVKFNISSQSLNSNVGVLGNVSFATVIRADAYRTLNSKKLEYINKTFEEKKLLKNTKYYLCFEKNIKYKEIYNSISDSLSLIVKNFVDEDNAPSFIFIGYDSSNIETIAQESTDLVSSSQIFKSRISEDTFYTTNPSEEGALEEGSLGWNNNGITLLMNSINQKTSKQSIPTNSILIFSGMNFSEKDLASAQIAYGSLISNSNILGVFLKHNSIQLNDVFEERKSIGQNIFGDLYYGIQENLFPAFQLVNILYKITGGNLTSEENLFEESSIFFGEGENGIALSGINPDTLISQCKNTVSEAIGSSAFDFDGDGTISLIDRIYSLYQNFDRNNQLIDDNFYGFFGDFGAEMRYWRKVCPHGQNYKLTGKIVSATADVAGNYILEVLPIWKDDDGNLYEPSKTTITVYAEKYVKSNFSYQTINDTVLEFQGRLFYPSYITKMNLSTVIPLSNPDELAAWYRFSKRTATRIVSEANGAWKDKPILFCRSNLGETDFTNSNVGQLFSPPPIFIGIENQFDSIESPSLLKISQLVEYVGDYIYNLDFNKLEEKSIAPGQTEIIFQTTSPLPQSAGGTGTQTVPISFYEIEFNVEVDGSTEDFYKYECEVLYLPSGESDFVPIYRFFSAVCFDTLQDQPPFRGKISFNASDPIRIYCKPAPEKFITSEDLDGRLFHIDMPYREVENFRYAFTFNQTFWNTQLYLNDRRVSALVVSSQDNFGKFNSEFSQINPFTGQILFKEKLDKNKNTVSIVFNHKKELKIGSQLSVRVLSGPSGRGVTISDVDINLSSSPSIERTEGEYSSTLYGDNYHLICPTQGFVSLSGSSWFFDQDEGTSNASNFSQGSITVIGNLVSPFLYFDAFANPTDIANKTIKMGNNITDFPIIDIPHTTIAVNVSGAPFTEVRTVGYTPPEQNALAKVDSIFDKSMKKFSILYNNNNILNLKYSFTKFRDFDTSDEELFFSNKSLRRNIPIYTGPLYIEEKIPNNEGVISIEDASRTAVGLEIITNSSFEESLERENGIFFLQSSSGGEFSSYGYVDGNGVKHTLLVPVYNEAESDFAKGYIQLPYSQGITQIKINKKSGTNSQDIISTNVQYVDNSRFANGVSGDIELFKTGDYVVFYYSDSENAASVSQIFGIMSSKDGQYWRRPGTNNLDDANTFLPIPILTNYSHPLLLGNESNDMMFLFVFGNQDNSVNLIHVTRSMFIKLVNGFGETDYKAPENSGKGNPAIEEPENSRSSMMINEEKNSWQEYFSGSGNHILPIVFNSSVIFSAAISKQGVIYFVSKSLDNEMRLKINFSEGGTEYSSGGWFDFGIDLFDVNGNLYKALQNFEIYAITLSYDSDMEGLHLFISTLDKLFVFRIPGAIIREANNSQKNLDEKVNKFYQDLVNDKKPTLIIGSLEGLSSEYVNLNGVASKEQFVPQQISVNWTDEGECWAFFLGSNNGLRCVKSSSDGNVWKTEEKV